MDEGGFHEFHHGSGVPCAQQFAERVNGFRDAVDVVGHGVVVDVVRRVDGVVENLPVSGEIRLVAVAVAADNPDGLQQQPTAQDIVVIGGFQQEAHQPVALQPVQMPLELFAGLGGFLRGRLGGGFLPGTLCRLHPGQPHGNAMFTKHALFTLRAATGKLEFAPRAPDFCPVNARPGDARGHAVRAELRLPHPPFAMVRFPDGIHRIARELAQQRAVEESIGGRCWHERETAGVSM